MDRADSGPARPSGTVTGWPRIMPTYMAPRPKDPKKDEKATGGPDYGFIRRTYDANAGF